MSRAYVWYVTVMNLDVIISYEIDLNRVSTFVRYRVEGLDRLRWVWWTCSKDLSFHETYSCRFVV
jgi:hypothetical protein